MIVPEVRIAHRSGCVPHGATEVRHGNRSVDFLFDFRDLFGIDSTALCKSPHVHHGGVTAKRRDIGATESIRFSYDAIEVGG